MPKGKKIMYTVTYSNHTHSCNAPSAQSACRKAFRYWIANFIIKKQPATTDAGGFQDVEVERKC